MNLKCKYHPNEVIERICASIRWKSDPALCWQCMVDQAPLVKEHKEHIVRLNEFTSRISVEFEKVTTLRKKDKSNADPDYIELINEADTQIYEYQETIEQRKAWVTQLIQSILNDFTVQCTKLQDVVYAQYDQKFKYFQDQFALVKEAIELRYGLSHLPSEEEISAKLDDLSKQEQDCNPYIRELKDKLLPPVELAKNLNFQESLVEVRHLREMALAVNQEDDKLSTEILKQVQEQCGVVVEEFKIGIQYRDLILSGNRSAAGKDIINESLNTLFDPEDAIHPESRIRTTHAQKLYDVSSALKDSKRKDQTYSPIDSPITNKPLSHIQHDQHVRTEQARGITSITHIKPNIVVTGSRDKTIQVTNFDAPQDSFTLEGHTDQVTALCPFQNKILISGGGNLDSSLIVWSLSQQKQIHKLVGHQSGITSIVDLMDGSSIASGSYDNHAIIWNVNDGTAVCALRKHTAMISCLNLTQRKDHLLTGSWDRTIGVWEINFDSRQVKGAKYQREIKCDSAVLCLQSIGANTQQVAYGGTGNKIVILDWQSGEVKRVLKTSQFGIQELNLLNDHTLVGLGASDGTIRVWDLSRKEQQEKDILRDPDNIYINNFNTSPKMVSLQGGRLAIVNNNDNNVHFNIYQIN